MRAGCRRGRPIEVFERIRLGNWRRKSASNPAAGVGGGRRGREKRRRTDYPLFARIRFVIAREGRRRFLRKIAVTASRGERGPNCRYGSQMTTVRRTIAARIETASGSRTKGPNDVKLRALGPRWRTKRNLGALPAAAIR